MYNRYIPQSDGSYRRNSIQESRPNPQRQAPAPQRAPASPPAQQPSARRPPQPEPVSAFLRQLLPKGLDTGDLIIVLLLLLIAGDNQERRSNALLTLALYFIM